MCFFARGVDSDCFSGNQEAFFLASHSHLVTSYRNSYVAFYAGVEIIVDFLPENPHVFDNVCKKHILPIFGCQTVLAIKMPYARVGAMPQPQNQSQPHPQSADDNKERPQGITMEVSSCSRSSSFSCSDLAIYKNQYQFLRTNDFPGSEAKIYRVRLRCIHS